MQKKKKKKRKRKKKMFSEFTESKIQGFVATFSYDKWIDMIWFKHLYYSELCRKTQIIMKINTKCAIVALDPTLI